MKKILTMNLPSDKEAVVRDICGRLGAEYSVLEADLREVVMADILEKSGNASVHSRKQTQEQTQEPTNKSTNKVTDKLQMEMAVFAGISSKELDIFLDLYKKSGAAPIALKSVITDTNKTWTLEKLYMELAREYLFYRMQGRP